MCKLSTAFGLFMLAAALGGCSNDDVLLASTDGQASSPYFVMSPDGVGPLNADTPYNLIRIGDAFQDFNVTEETTFQQGEKVPVITIRKDVEPLLSINPDFKHNGIFSIIVHDNRVANRLGHRLGDSYRDVYHYGKVEKCVPALAEWKGKVMCYAPDAGNILYLFAGGQGLADDQVPPPEQMADWQLDAIVWKPPVG